MTIRRLLIVGAVGLALFCAGCVAAAAAPVVHAVIGPEADYVVLDKPAAYFQDYSTIEIEPPASGMGKTCPPEFLEAYQKGVADVLLKKPYFARVNGADNPLAKRAGGKALIVNSTVIDYSVGGTLNRLSTMGRNTYVVVRADLVDKSSGKTICTANIRGVIKSAALGKPIDLAHGVGKGFAKLFRDHYAPAK